MQRMAMQDVTLSDGTFMPKGTLMELYSGRMWDPTIIEHPDKFDPYRWVKLRDQPGKEGYAQHVTTSQDFPVWGHGTWSCPGRFFANNELKIAVCHIIMKYDVQFAGKNPIAILKYTMNRIPAPGLKIRARKRVPEINLDDLVKRAR